MSDHVLHTCIDNKGKEFLASLKNNYGYDDPRTPLNKRNFSRQYGNSGFCPYCGLDIDDKSLAEPDDGTAIALEQSIRGSSFRRGARNRRGRIIGERPDIEGGSA